MSTIVTTVLIALSLPAYAQSDTYFGIGVYQTTSKDNTTLSGVTLKYKKINYKALIGKHIDDNWSIEAQYVNIAKDNITANGLATRVDISGSSIGVAGLYHFNQQADYSPFIKLGWHSWDSKAINTNAGVSAKGDGTDAFYAVGVDGKINETMKYRLEFERMKTDSDNLDNIGVGLLFDF